jgi:magnesium and cobalt exporter, CNNM family
MVWLAAILALVAANGMFVAAEFAIVSVRRTRLIPLAEGGSKTARLVLHAAEDPNPFLAATQLGITMASLGLGWIGGPVVTYVFAPLLHSLSLTIQEATADVIAGTLAFTIITTLHIVFGELAAKSAALWRPEGTAFFVVPPTMLFYHVFKPFIVFLNSAANATLAVIGLRAPSSRYVHSPEEIDLLVTESRQAGLVGKDEAALMHRVFKLTDRVAEEVMVPRIAVRALSQHATIADAAVVVREAGYTRLPVFADTLDTIVGMVHAKDLLLVYMEGRHEAPVTSVMRKALYVPETKPVVDLLEEMRTQNTQLAVVIDEFGGTSGIVTMEDLLEELVGEIPGELRKEKRLILMQQADRILVDATIPLDVLNEAFNVSLPTAESNTLGGFIFHYLDKMPEAGTTFRYNGLEFRIDTKVGQQIGVVQIRKRRSD